MRHLLPISLVLNAALASAAPFSAKLPASLPLQARLSGKLPLLPVQVPPLPVQLPVEVAAPATMAPAVAGNAESVFLRWDLLEGEDDGLMSSLAPVIPGPKPLSPAGAMAQLEYAPQAPLEVFDATRVPVLSR